MADENAQRDDKGRFAAGNRFWEARSSAGANPKFEFAVELWDACCQYFEWVEANPLMEARPFAYQGAITIAEVAKMRAMTLQGLCLFIDVTVKTWTEWRTTRPDLSNVITRVEAIIYQQKFSGAAADLLNPNIIARDLGLADKSELSGPNGGPINVSRIELVPVAPKRNDDATD